MDVKVLLDGLDSFRFSCAVFLRQKLVQLGDDVAPNMWTCVWWSFDSFVKSLFGHHRKLSTSRSFGLTKTWWNIASILATTAIGSFLKRMRTPTRLYVKSEPWSNWSFSEVPLNLAVQSKTTRIFPGLWGLETAWCRIYQIGLPSGSSSSSGTFLAWPFVIYPSTASTYLTQTWSFLRSRFFNRRIRDSANCRLFGKHAWRFLTPR